uniref:TIL domain-containing protein n=1 Tax=Latrodectus hesperus TaxID=256737 RepID=E7D1U9_LATHE|nr:hypothetical protein [Latrodectus hesperus]
MKYIVIVTVIALIATACFALPNKECDASKGEEFQTCGTACPDTCSNLNNKPIICTMQCIIGCGCPAGTVRRESDQHCVKPSEC